MDSKTIIYIIIIIAIGLALFHPETREDDNSGALIQLMAKDAQDTYLTGDAWKYAPFWYYGPYGYPYSTRGYDYPGRYLSPYPYY